MNNDAAFLRFRADLMDAALGAKLPDLQFRNIVRALAKKHGLTRTYAVSREVTLQIRRLTR